MAPVGTATDGLGGNCEIPTPAAEARRQIEAGIDTNGKVAESSEVLPLGDVDEVSWSGETDVRGEGVMPCLLIVHLLEFSSEPGIILSLDVSQHSILTRGIEPSQDTISFTCNICA